MHEQADLVRYDRYDCDAKLPKPMWMLWAEFLGVMAVLWVLHVMFEEVKMSIPWSAQQYPGQGKVHYTFELEDGK